MAGAAVVVAAISATGWIALGVGMVTLLSAIAGVAWRVGRLEQKVTDLATQFSADRAERIAEHRRQAGLPERRGEAAARRRRAARG